MTVNMPSSTIEIKLNVVTLKLDRLIDEMRFLKSHTIAFDTRLRGIEAYLKPSERQPESKSTPLLAAAASATARTALFAVGAAIGAALTKLYLEHDPSSDRLSSGVIHLWAGAARAFSNEA
jgi:hypothetical protein